MPDVRFRSLVHDHSPDLFRYALWLCGDPRAAREMVRETFVQAWPERELLVVPGARAALASGVRRQHARRYGVRALDLSRVPASTFADEDDDAPAAHLAIAGLKADDREPLILSEVCGFGHAEIGVVLGMPPSAVVDRLERARARMSVDLEARRPKPRRPSNPRMLRHMWTAGLMGLASLGALPLALLPDLETQVTRHVLDEREERPNGRRHIPNEVLMGALHGVGARMSGALGSVVHAGRCKHLAGGAVHMVIDEPAGLTDVLIIPRTRIEERREDERGGLVTALIPMGTGTVAVTGESWDAVMTVEDRVRQQIWFVTDL